MPLNLPYVGKLSPEQRVVSPGVFTSEIDLSGLAAGVQNIGAVIVAPFAKGPGFSPMTFSDINVLEETFGLPDGVYYGPYAAEGYLKEKGFVTVCRVGALTGYKQANPLLLYAVPGEWQRTGLTGSYTLASYCQANSADNSPLDILTYNADDSLTLSCSVIATFGNSGSWSPTSSGEDFWNQTLNIGTIAYKWNSGAFYISSSIQNTTASNAQKLLQAITECNTTTSSLSMSFNAATVVTPSSEFETVGILSMYSASFIALRSPEGCGNFLYTSGSVMGKFGDYTDTFIATHTGAFPDPCITAESSSGDPIILAVLADTLNSAPDTDYIQSGFSGSTLSYMTSSNGYFADSTDYVLNLKKDNETIQSYKFSIDLTSNNYITSVFGLDPTVGDPDTQVAGQKIEAAYLYKLFIDNMDTVANNKHDYQIQVGTSMTINNYALSASVISSSLVQSIDQVGDVMNFLDPTVTDISSQDSAFALTNAYTPWINSQNVGDVSNPVHKRRFPLFRVHTMSDGTPSNVMYKVEISNVKLAGQVPGSDWGTFTLSVRDFNDTDKAPVYLEIFQNLNLNPVSADFVARRIGDRYNWINASGKIKEFGTFANLSKYIRIEMTENNYPTISVPYGFDAYSTPIDSNYALYTPKMYYSKASTYETNPGKYPSGLVLSELPVGADATLIGLYPTSSYGVGVDRDTLEYMSPLPHFGSIVSIGRNEVFDLEENYTDGGVVTGNGVPSVYDPVNENTNVKMRKFILGFQGGFDGQSPSIPINIGSDITAGNTQGLDCTIISSPGSIAYKQCIGALGNADEWDINLMFTPGIFSSLHPYVVNLAVDTCEARGDCFYVFDNIVFPKTNQSIDLISAAVQEASNFDTSYAATYYPWVRILDTNINQYVAVPPSVVIPSVYALNDVSSAEWFAPAGLNRGGITVAKQVLDRTTHQDRDALYEGRVNPIAAFPGQGISVWGQKTLQVKPSALDRINVRRLLINLKKFISSSAKFLLFEQNVSSTRNRFLAICNPYLENVKQRSGLYAFQVICDETNNTPALIDQNVLMGNIYLQPAKAIEYIIIPFTVTATGATFPTGV